MKFFRSAIFGLVAFSIVGGALGYSSWRRSHLEKQAQQFFAHHNYTAAALTCRRLLQIDAENIVACRVMAESARNVGSAEAASWFQRLASLAPTNENQLDLAASAVALKKNDLAGFALEKVSGAARDSVRFHELAGVMAVGENRRVLALQHFCAAEKCDPNNSQIKFDRVVVELTLGGERAAKAREDLATLTLDDKMRLNALRALVSEAVSRGDSAAQENWETRLRADREASFADFLLCLESAAARHQEQAPLAQIKNAAQKSPALAAAIVSWMNRHERAQEALDWIGALPESVTRTQPLPLAIAESYSCAHRWPELRAFIESDDWKNLEPLRLTIAHHATRQLSPENSITANSLWHEAIESAHSDNNQLLAMAEMCRGWGYDSEADEAYWLVASGSAKVDSALAALQHHYQSRRDARGLFRVAQRAAQINPDDLIAINNCASLGLLLNDDNGSHRLAEKLYEAHPRSAAFASTYAFALHREGRTADALKLLDRFKMQMSKSPALAANYVVISVANGNFDGARPFLGLAERARLLPEEENLLRDAIGKL